MIQGASANDLAVDSPDPVAGTSRCSASASTASTTPGRSARSSRAGCRQERDRAHRRRGGADERQPGVCGVRHRPVGDPRHLLAAGGRLRPPSDRCPRLFKFPWYALTLQSGPGPTRLCSTRARVRISSATRGRGPPTASRPIWQMHSDFHALAYDAAGRLWIGNDGSIYRTTDFSTVTNRNTNLSITQFEPGIGVVRRGPVRRHAGQRQPPLRRRQVVAAARRLRRGLVGHPPHRPAAHRHDAGDTSCFGHLIFRTVDGGANVFFADTGVTLTESGLFYSPLVSSPASPDRLYYGRTHLWTSADFAQSWTALPAASDRGSRRSAHRVQALGSTSARRPGSSGARRTAVRSGPIAAAACRRATSPTSWSTRRAREPPTRPSAGRGAATSSRRRTSAPPGRTSPTRSASTRPRMRSPPTSGRRPRRCSWRRTSGPSRRATTSWQERDAGHAPHDHARRRRRHHGRPVDRRHPRARGVVGTACRRGRPGGDARLLEHA